VRGVHIDRIVRELDWLVVNKVPAKKKRSRRGQKGGGREDKEGQIEIKQVALGDAFKQAQMVSRRRRAIPPRSCGR
jgi:hypothetical protein